MVRVLVISDELPQREKLLYLIRRLGIQDAQIDSPTSWEDALLAVENSFDLAIIDLCLVHWNFKEGGYELIRRLHDRHRQCKTIAISDYYEQGGPRAYDEGARAFVYTQWNDISWTRLLTEHIRIFLGLTEREEKRKANSTATETQPV